MYYDMPLDDQDKENTATNRRVFVGAIGTGLAGGFAGCSEMIPEELDEDLLDPDEEDDSEDGDNSNGNGSSEEGENKRDD